MYVEADLSHSVCFNVALVLSQKQKYYSLGDKPLPVIKQGFLRSEENVNLNNFSTFDGI